MAEARTSPYVLYASHFQQVNAILILNNHIHLIFLLEWFVEGAHRPIHKNAAYYNTELESSLALYAFLWYQPKL